jgi:hypothetical protein
MDVTATDSVPDNIPENQIADWIGTTHKALYGGDLCLTSIVT